ncbi:hypothetical protein SAMN05216338_1001265 [Bradyrhizobium sp. Rc2d]|uniref:hypothetical protein n=1 Tax=Bradyrhizobium sp. Rc2d TaxID=1855321 RepID=UPI0008904CB8|nr:hypothetical protein [Bradyrhizobium sp. Rc2d]SDG42786.1 hypothetical protein SAMN05216338_1001265 [Bradyrhizobium sp. Rc2d]
MNEKLPALARASSVGSSQTQTDIETLKLIVLFSGLGLLLSLAAMIYWPELGAEMAQALWMLD